MTRLLLDTSAYSAFLKGHAGLKAALQETDEIFVNPIVLGELKAGFRGGKRRTKNEAGLAEFLASPRVAVLPVDQATSDCYVAIFGYLRGAGTPLPTHDLWIAATAMQHGLPVATTDAHFSRVPQILTTLFDSGDQGPPTTGA